MIIPYDLHLLEAEAIRDVAIGDAGQNFLTWSGGVCMNNDIKPRLHAASS